MRAPGPLLASTVIALLALAWGTTWAAIRISLEGFPPVTGVVLRFAAAAAVLVAVARVLGVPLGGAGRREWAPRLSQGTLSFRLAYGIVFWAEQWVPSGLAAAVASRRQAMTGVAAALPVVQDEDSGRWHRHRRTGPGSANASRLSRARITR